MREIVRILCGSHLYGTNVEGSDKDYKVVFIPDAKDILLQRVEQAVCEKIDGEDVEFLSLQRFLHLACQGQTNAMDMLFAPSEFYVGKPAPEWFAVLKNRQKFVSKNCEAFMGYCREQVRKYVIKKERMQAMDSVVAALQTVPQPGITKLNSLDLPGMLDFENPLIAITSTRTSRGVTFQHLSVCGLRVDLSASVRTALAAYEGKAREYGARIRKTDTDHAEDWKSTYHAVRVAHEAVELMTSGHLTFPRPEKELLLAIREGRLPYSVVSQMIEDGLKSVKSAVASSELPAKPDYATAERLVELFYRQEIHDTEEIFRPR